MADHDDGEMQTVEAITAFRCECCRKVTIVFYDIDHKPIAFASLEEEIAMLFHTQYEAALMLPHDGHRAN